MYLFTVMGICALSKVGITNMSCTGVLVNTRSCFYWMYTEEWSDWVVGYVYVKHKEMLTNLGRPLGQPLLWSGCSDLLPLFYRVVSKVSLYILSDSFLDKCITNICSISLSIVFSYC